MKKIKTGIRGKNPDGTLHPIEIHVGQKIRLARIFQNMSQETLAQKVGLTFQQIQKYELAKNRIAVSRLWEIAKVLELPLSYFFEDFNAKTSPNYQTILKLLSLLNKKLDTKILNTFYVAMLNM